GDRGGAGVAGGGGARDAVLEAAGRGEVVVADRRQVEGGAAEAVGVEAGRRQDGEQQPVAQLVAQLARRQAGAQVVVEGEIDRLRHVEGQVGEGAACPVRRRLGRQGGGPIEGEGREGGGVGLGRGGGLGGGGGGGAPGG